MQCEVNRLNVLSKIEWNQMARKYGNNGWSYLAKAVLVCRDHFLSLCVASWGDQVQYGIFVATWGTQRMKRMSFSWLADSQEFMPDETLAKAFHGIVEGLCVSAGIEVRSIRHCASEHLEIRLFNQTLTLKTVYLELEFSYAWDILEWVWCWCIRTVQLFR